MKAVWLSALVALLALSAHAEDYTARAIIKAEHRAVLSSELAGIVTELPFHIGDHFTQGQTLVGLDCRLYLAQQQRVEAQVHGAKQKLVSSQELQKLHSIGAVELATVQAEYDQQVAALKVASLNSERCTISAPWDGDVVAVQTRRHESVQAQQQLIEIVSREQLRSQAVVPAAWLIWLKTGMPVTLNAPELAVSETAHVRAINPVIDPVSQTVEVALTLPKHSKLVIGASVSASFNPSVDNSAEPLSAAQPNTPPSVPAAIAN